MGRIPARAPAADGRMVSLAEAPQRPIHDALHEIYATHDVLSWDPSGAIVVRPRAGMSLAEEASALTGRQLAREAGMTGNSRYWGDREDEYHPKLRGQEGLKVYDQMRRSDPQVAKTLLLAKTPVISGRWFVEPASNADRDKEIADFVWDCLETHLNTPFEQVLWEALTMLDFGFSVFEKVMERRVINGKPRWVWKKFAQRSPLDVYEWHWDKNGGPEGITFHHSDREGRFEEVRLPISKLLVFTHKKEFGSMTGISLLRSAYKPWWYKDNLIKIDAIQKERHATGVPIIKLPPGFDDRSEGNKSDVALARQIGRNLRTNERAYVVLPPMWEIEFARLDTQPVDAVPSIEFHNREIADNILAAWSAGGGSDTDTMMDMFLRASRHHAQTIAYTINKHAIPQLVQLNYGVNTAMPRLRVRRIGEDKIDRELSFTLRNYIGADLIRADAGTEAWLRDQLQLPEYDEATDRKLLEIKRQEEQAAISHARAVEINQAKASSAGSGAPGAGGSGSAGKPAQGRGGKAGAPRQTPAQRKTGAGTSKVGGDTGNIRTK